MKTIKIGENEYTPGFESTLAKWVSIPMDSQHKLIDIADNIAALNELAALRETVGKLEQVVSALALGWTFVDEWHSKVVDSLVKGDMIEAKNLAIMEYPCLQGHRNQMNVIALGKREFDNEVVGSKISEMAEIEKARE